MSPSQLNTREQFAAIVSIVKAAKCRNLGKKALQKLIYLLEKEIELNLGYEFKFYTHGVFSRDLAGDIDVMKSMRLLDVQYDEKSESYKINIGPEADRFLEKGCDWRKVDLGKIKTLAERYSCLPAWKLEIISTAVYAEQEEGVDRKSTCDRVKELKPKFSPDEIYGVLNESWRN